MEAVLRVAVELQVHRNVDVFQHNRLEDLDPGPRLLRREDVVQDLQRALLVADGRELVRALERILGFLCEERVSVCVCVLLLLRRLDGVMRVSRRLRVVAERALPRTRQPCAPP